MAEQLILSELKQRTAALVAAQKISQEVFVDVPESVSERVRLLEDLSAWRLNERTLAEANELGRACFGGLWRCADSDWTALANAAGWVRGK